MSRGFRRFRSLVIIGLVTLAALTVSAPAAADTYGGPWPFSAGDHVHVGPWAR
jgi:hypothetical protein